MFSNLFAGLAVLLALSCQSAQDVDDCSQTNLQPCFADMDLFRETTCDPLAQGNNSIYLSCLCYYDIHYEYCFKECPLSPTIQKQADVFAGRVSQDCNREGMAFNVRLTPEKLWSFYVNPQPSSSSSSVAGTVVKTDGSPQATGTPGTAAKSGTSTQSINGLLIYSTALIMPFLLAICL